MDFAITSGIPAAELSAWLENANERHGTFDDGRVNYTHADLAPIIMCTVLYQDKILLVKRSDKVGDAKGYWSTINGFIDQDIPIQEITAIELREELQLSVDHKAIKVGDSYKLKNTKEIRSYLVFPCLVILATQPSIILDEEHTDYRWVSRIELEDFHILADLPHAIDQALSLL